MKKIVPADATLIPDNARCVFRGQIFDAYQWDQQLFDGSIATFEMLRRPDTVIALCVVDGNILVIDEQQPHHGDRVGFPCGRVDSTDESILAAAQREVLEETGYQFEHWRLVDVKKVTSKIEWFAHTFVAWNVTSEGSPNLDPGEKISIERKPLAEVKQLALERQHSIGESLPILEQCDAIDQLLALPEFQGIEVDR